MVEKAIIIDTAHVPVLKGIEWYAKQFKGVFDSKGLVELYAEQFINCNNI